ncbi:MAG TPA: SLBB domain-containing protein [Candidatus Koribacter sp.]|jgi:protein involved in polysaccharide export with SLBB domain
MRKLCCHLTLSLFICAVVLLSQAIAQEPQVAPEADANPGVAASSQLTLPAAAIIDILRSRPELIVEVKQVAAQSLQAAGTDIRDDSITDEMLFREINTNADVRKQLTSWLWTRGYVSADDLQRYAENEIPEVKVPVASTSGNVTDIDTAAAPMNSGDLNATVKPNATLQGRKAPARQRERNSEPTTADSAQHDPNQPDTGGLVHQPTPLNLLALRDLYTQVPEQSSSLRRFGSDAFLHHGMDPAELPTDLPAGNDYVLGPGDLVQLTLWGGISQTLSRPVDAEGRLVLPEAGPIGVSGLTLAQAQGAAENALRPQFREIHVQLSLARVRTIRVYVVGDVQRPGAYDVSSLSTTLNALYAAGGPTAVGSLRIVRHYRNSKLIHEVDLYDFLLHGMRDDPVLLQAGDTVLVPPAGRQVTVAGMVRRPAIYELRQEQTLDDVIGLAGGLLVSASTASIRLERVHAFASRSTESVEIPNPADLAALRTSLEAVPISDGDRIFVAPVLPYSERAVYVEGHVVRPGKFAYRDEMLITDVLHSYADLLPEPADRAEIIRLRPPDYRPETIEFNLGEAMIGNTHIRLQPFDTIRVLGRYELDAPKVTIQGEVLRPGSYPMSADLTVAQLVRLAGGFKRSALLDHADLTSYEVQNGSSVAGHRTTVEIGRAVVDADTAADVKLKPGDVLTIHQISGWNDIGASVTLSGEVAYPGTYGVQQGERLSSVLRRAGGFRDTAYPTGALLTRLQVRDFQDKSRDELIRQIETTSAATKISPTVSGSDQAAMLQLVMQQQEQVLQRLKTQPATGRLVIKISPDVAQWQNTPADIELRAGDVLEIPKRPGFVLVTGQVYNSAAITYTPGKDAAWYLRRSGGPTEMASKKEIFIIRANGSVVGRDSTEWFGNEVLRTKLDPGDVLVVPQKIIGGSVLWRNLLATAQFMSSFAITAKVAGF